MTFWISCSYIDSAPYGGPFFLEIDCLDHTASTDPAQIHPQPHPYLEGEGSTHQIDHKTNLTPNKSRTKVHKVSDWMRFMSQKIKSSKLCSKSRWHFLVKRIFSPLVPHEDFLPLVVVRSIESPPPDSIKAPTSREAGCVVSSVLLCFLISSSREWRHHRHNKSKQGCSWVRAWQSHHHDA